jgi:hypothetical protein
MVCYVTAAGIFVYLFLFYLHNLRYSPLYFIFLFLVLYFIFFDERFVVQCVRKVAVHLGYFKVRYADLVVVVDITSNTCYKCTATFRMQICIKCWRIKLNGFRHI